MTEHLLTLEPQPIADQMMAKCSCGWRKAVSIYEVQRGGPSMANIATQLHEQHKKEAGDAA